MRPPKNRQLASMISLGKLSNRSAPIRSLIKQAESRQSLEDVLNDILPELFKTKFSVHATDNMTLTLSCNSAALMTRFRFSMPKILADLNHRIQPRQFNNIHIKVRPEKLPNKQSSKLGLQTSEHQSSKKMSKKNAQILSTEAEHTNDKALREVLLRLADRSH